MTIRLHGKMSQCEKAPLCITSLTHSFQHIEMLDKIGQHHYTSPAQKQGKNVGSKHKEDKARAVCNCSVMQQ